MKLWSDFYDLMAPDVPGCPFAAVDTTLRQAAIAFCENSLVWTYEHPPVSMLAGTASYGFVPPAGAVVHAIIQAEIDGREIDSLTAEADIQAANCRNQMGTPEYVLGGATLLTLVPIPGAAGTLMMTVALKPSPDANGIEDSIFNEYREAIIHGALARLTLSPKKPYTNAQLAQYHGQQFAIKTGNAGMRVARSYTRAPLRTRIRGRA